MNEKLKAILCLGVSASGKSTFAKELLEKDNSWHQIERDRIRELILINEFKIPKGKNQWECEYNIWNYWKFRDEYMVNDEVDGYIEYAHRKNKNIICSDTNLNKKYRQELKSKLESLGYEVEYKVFGFDLTFEELCKRDNYRKNSVGFDIIAKQYEQFRKEFPKYELKDVSDKPKAILVDLDGTFFNMGDRSPFSWDEVYKDTVNQIIKNSVYGLSRNGYEIIFLSGRDECCYEMSKKMILDSFSDTPDGYLCHTDNFKLYMRKNGDIRSDVIIKLELFFANIDGNYNVGGVFDDRPTVCNLWRELNLKVYQCANPFISF